MARRPGEHSIPTRDPNSHPSGAPGDLYAAREAARALAARLPSWSMDLFVHTPQERSAWSPRFRREVERGIALYERGGA